MRRHQHRLMFYLAVSMLALIPLTGCGQNASGSSGSQSGFTGTPGSLQLVKTSTLQTAGPTRLPSPPAPQPMRGTVVLHVGAMLRPAHEAITFTLRNQTNQAIFFADHQSGCAVILLQMVPESQDNGQWQTLAPCKALIMARLHTLEAGLSLTITFNPPTGQWIPGLYRGVLSYAAAETGGQEQTIFSSTFVVGN